MKRGETSGSDSNMPKHDDRAAALIKQFVEQSKRLSADTASNTLVAALEAQYPASSEVWACVAEGMIQAGFAHAASGLLNVALARFPRNVALCYWRGNALRLDGCHADAERDFRAALITAPSHRDAALSLAHMLREDGRLTAAVEVIEASLHACADDQAYFLVGLTFMRECRAHVQAQALATAAHMRWPGDAKLAALKAEFALAAGDFTGGLDAVRAALAGNPRDGISWFRLAYCRRFETRNDSDAQRLEQAWRSGALDPDSRICVGFALGKMLADVGERADAVSMLREANAAAAARTLWHTAD